MIFMSTSVILCQNLVLSKNSCASENSFPWGNALSSVAQLSCWRRKHIGVVPNAKKKHAKKRKWWQRFFFDEDGNWFGLRDDDAFEVLESEGESSDEELSANEKFEEWKRRAEAIVELREAQEDAKNEENRRWEDWLVDGTNDNVGYDVSWFGNSNGTVGKPVDDLGEQISEEFSSRGLVKSVRDLIIGKEDDDILYEDHVFRYASFNSFIPIHSVQLDIYVKTVPLAAQMLDVRKSQKLEMVKALKLEKARYRLEVEIGKSPALSDEELYEELRHKALELRDEWRLENRKAFANIWSDMVFGVSLFLLLYFNQNQVALLRFTGYKLLNNITDTGKAFLIILITDIFLGYHSESGWQTLLEVMVEHYGLEIDQAAITVFICLIPVVIDACVKLWLFKYLPRLSPKVANIFEEMKRH